MRFVCGVLCRLVALLGAWMTFDAYGAGKLTWETRQIDCTAGVDDKKVVAVFRFKNEGDGPVTITSVKPTCGCTTAELAKDTYAPGERGEIKATFTFENRAPFQQKAIDVTTDSASDKSVSLMLRVKLPEPITCSSTLVLWDIGADPRETTVTITPVGSREIMALEAKASPPSALILKIESAANGAFRIGVRPTATSQLMQVTISCVATLDEGTEYPFQLHALVR